MDVNALLLVPKGVDLQTSELSAISLQFDPRIKIMNGNGRGKLTQKETEKEEETVKLLIRLHICLGSSFPTTELITLSEGEK